LLPNAKSEPPLVQLQQILSAGTSSTSLSTSPSQEAVEVSKHVEDKKVIWSSQHIFMKRKSFLSNLAAFCDEVTSWLD